MDERKMSKLAVEYAVAFHAAESGVGADAAVDRAREALLNEVRAARRELDTARAIMADAAVLTARLPYGAY